MVYLTDIKIQKNAMNFMSDKHRPYWDMEFLISLGYRRVFAEPRIDELVRDEKAQEFYKLFPEFLVGGIK